MRTGEPGRLLFQPNERVARQDAQLTACSRLQDATRYLKRVKLPK